MATILTKKSDTSSAVPASGDLTNSTGGAELAVNTADKRIFTKNSGGTVVELGTNPSTLTVDTDTLVVDATNNRVGIGTSSPTVALDVSGVASANNIRATTTFQLVDSLGTARNVLQLNSDDLTIQTGTTAGARSITFLTENTERLRIDSSGNVGIGTSSPSLKLDVIGAIRINEDGAGTKVIQVRSDWAGVNPAINVQTNHPLLFNTNGTERMRIDSSGNLLVGTTSSAFGTAPKIETRVADGRAFGVSNSGTGTATAAIFVNNSGSSVGSITFTTTATTYATSSDYRLKENVAPMTGALATIAALNPVTYTWKVDGSAGQGFIAHELQAVVPDCVTGEKDAVDAEGKPVYQGVDTSFLVATLTAAIQELKAENDALKSRLDAAGL